MYITCLGISQTIVTMFRDFLSEKSAVQLKHFSYNPLAGSSKVTVIFELYIVGYIGMHLTFIC